MERIISKLMRALVVTLFCTTAVTTASSQEKQNVVDLNALAARGEVLTNEDPLALELGNQLLEWRRAFHIGMGAAEGNTLPGPGKDGICASLSSASESKTCNIAVRFSVDRNRYADLAARGAEIAKDDPWVALVRTLSLASSNRRLPSRGVSYRLGFNIGLAAAERDTLPGPGKDKIRDSLIGLETRAGFVTAVSFSLDRNRNRNADPKKDLPSIGARIAAANPVVAAARVSEVNELYLLGFDIATGLFGDPAQGAVGNTLMGPGSQRLRDSLSPRAQSGFDASVKLHLSRKY